VPVCEHGWRFLRPGWLSSQEVMRGHYSAIASRVGIRAVGALVLLAGVGGLFLVSRAPERGQTIDFAPLVVPPSRVAAPSVVFAPFVGRGRPGARAQRPSQGSTSGAGLGSARVSVYLTGSSDGVVTIAA